MKREYTLLTIGLLVIIFEWVGLTTSARQTVISLLGLWLIFIAYRYRAERLSGKLQVNKIPTVQDEPKIPEPNVLETKEQLIYEHKQQKPRI
ncbi:hypothetical protein A3J61_01600 [Candidatus Nomurabacteria bacterium RIFCSPHIGHO2_02_FULL_38_15]|uniref:Uncharacterized protein n=1 Tax=Candidatus Nomurabacteria bacterium RIFCSPHIGHO2_02_FULL_38_15 TaxID=1801752 RepID=A0A1F6VQS7_9BACT|nr:MAG: hypothetical protein A3J61_01600 [Candidatus Nomurabacteria bacterium RIFCSPHIGHO2_02_FULL_38_15]